MNQQQRNKYARKYYKKNREKILEKAKIYRQKNREKESKRLAIYRQKNKKRIRMLDKIYYRKNIEKRKHYLQTFKGRYKIIKSGAVNRNLEWKITIKQFESFWQKPCHYCGEKTKTIGLDRVDNKKGYTIDNVVSCCPICNWMKRDYLVEDFIKHCQKIINHSKII